MSRSGNVPSKIHILSPPCDNGSKWPDDANVEMIDSVLPTAETHQPHRDIRSQTAGGISKWRRESGYLLPVTVSVVDLFDPDF